MWQPDKRRLSKPEAEFVEGLEQVKEVFSDISQAKGNQEKDIWEERTINAGEKQSQKNVLLVIVTAAL